MADDGLEVARRSEPCTFEVDGRTVSGLWTGATRSIAVAVIAHGAGAGMQHPFMAGVAEALAAGGVTTLRFNFPYMESRRGGPDRVPVLLRTWEAAMQHAAGRGHGLPIIAGGKSLGGRMASMLAAAQGQFGGTALVFFGYPLHPPGRTGQQRDAHLPRIRVPMLFIQGSRDALARLDLMEALVARLPLARLHVVAGGDHSFRIPGVKRSDEDIGRAVAQIAGAYIKEMVEGSGRREPRR
jgi:uncharacterized protein